MKVIRNSLIPFPGFLGINILGLVFVRRKEWDALPRCIRQLVLSHEAIHTAQLLELGILPFYLIYFAEWLFRLCQDPRTAYRRISFEREAYAHEAEPHYLQTRKHYAQWSKS